MKKSELQELAERLLDIYGNDRHFEITKAEKYGGLWQLEVQEVKCDDTETDKGAENESNK